MRILLSCLVACSLALPLAGCEWAGGSATGRAYRLASIDGDPLPAPLPAALSLDGSAVPVLDVVSGSLELHDDGTVTETWTLECRTDLPAGASCGEPEQVWIREGTHSAEPMAVRIHDARFATSSVTAIRHRIVLRTRGRGGSGAVDFAYVR